MVSLLLALTWFGGRPEETVTHKLFTLLAGVIFFGGAALVLYVILRLVSHFMRTRFSGTLGEHVFEITGDALTETNSNGRIETRFGAIRRIDETTHHFIVITSTGLGHVIPKRDLENPSALRELRSKISGDVHTPSAVSN